MSDRMTSDGDVARDETHALISSDKVEGSAVYGPDRSRIGSVYTLMIEKTSGHVSYAVVSFGGFLGIGDEYYPLPWDSLAYDTELGGYVAKVTRDQLEGAPRYRADEMPWRDPAYGPSVNQYYAVPTL
jgi:hypothetical protein